MSDDITDTGPMLWSRPRTSRLEVAAHVTVIACLIVIVALAILWGGR
jgi:hypothetical protein